MIRFRNVGGIFNLPRLKTKASMSSVFLLELQFADDCALMAFTLNDPQNVMDNFQRAASRYGLIISIEYTEVRPQP